MAKKCLCPPGSHIRLKWNYQQYIFSVQEVICLLLYWLLNFAIDFWNSVLVHLAYFRKIKTNFSILILGALTKGNLDNMFIS